MKLNRLASATSPYLLQHKSDLVDWYPWSDEAINKAIQLDKPVFLSIGYSTCHWCHVQHHLSFQNTEIVDLLNDNFVCIKVDKEQRPDVDAMYMPFVINITGGGGHPMSIFTTPRMRPFFGGTYFDPSTFKSLLINVAEKWDSNKKDLLESADHVHGVLSNQDSFSLIKADHSANVGDLLMRHYIKSFDSQYGGFSIEPKFPTAPELSTLFRIAINAIPGLTNDKHTAAWAMFTKTLQHINMGGIHDHVEGGFHRYAVDRSWMVPHFEKMLSTQAQLLELYSSAFSLGLSKNKENASIFLDTALDIYQYTSTYLKSPLGGYFTAEDADSEVQLGGTKAEGAFAVWTNDELKELLGSNYDIFKYMYGVEPNGNVDVQYDHQGELRNKNILIQRHSVNELASKFNKSKQDIKAVLEDCKLVLRNKRSQRPRPFRDDKIVSNWNGMMVSGLIALFKATRDNVYLQESIKLLEFIFDKLTVNNELWRDFKHEQQPTTKGFSDDYASVVKACIDVYTVTVDDIYLEKAIMYQKSMDDLYWDAKNGGYYTATKNEYIIQTKDIQDGADPSAQTMGLENLIKLGLITGDMKYIDKSEKLKEIYSGLVLKMPQALIGFSGVYATNYKKISINIKDLKNWDKLTVYPTVFRVDNTLDGNYIECIGDTCKTENIEENK